MQGLTHIRTASIAGPRKVLHLCIKPTITYIIFRIIEEHNRGTQYWSGEEKGSVQIIENVEFVVKENTRRYRRRRGILL